MDTPEFVALTAWRGRYAVAASNFLRWAKGRRGFWRISRRVRTVAERTLAGRYVPVRYFEGYLWVDPGRRLDRWLFNDGIYEIGTTTIIRRACADGWSVVDIGANLGDHVVAAGLSRRQAGQRIAAFEPDPRVVGVLAANLERNGLGACVEVYPIAIAADSATHALDTRSDPDASFLTEDSRTAGVEMVSTRPLDEVLGDGFPPDVVLKIDVEGAEPLVFDGARRFLEQRPETVVLVEHNPEALARAGHHRLAVLDRLHGLGLRVWRIDDASVRLVEIGDREALTFCNLLAARAIPPFLN